MHEILAKLCSGASMTQSQSFELFSRIIAGQCNDIEISALLVALKIKGETVEEIAGAAMALRSTALAFDVADLAVADTCGTGGDGLKTINVSTAAAIVVAEAGVKVVKHGNRAVSSQCGSADLLESCGIKIDAAPAVSKKALDELNLCFLFAPYYHRGVAYAMPVRRNLGIRTIFNLIGPLANPAKPRFQLVGVYNPDLCVPLARTLGLLGCERALVVHGSGLDEIALHGPTQAAYWDRGQLQEFNWTPESWNLNYRNLNELIGGTAKENALWLRELLQGRGSAAHNEVVALNAGAVLWLAGKALSVLEGMEQAIDILQSGRSLQRLERWAEISHVA